MTSSFKLGSLALNSTEVKVAVIEIPRGVGPHGARYLLLLLLPSSLYLLMYLV